MLTKHRVMKELGHGTPGRGHGARGRLRTWLGAAAPTLCAVDAAARVAPAGRKTGSLRGQAQRPQLRRRPGCVGGCARLVPRALGTHARHGIARGRLPATPERHASEFAVLWALTLDGQVPATPLLGVTDGAATEKPPPA